MGILIANFSKTKVETIHIILEEYNNEKTLVKIINKTTNIEEKENIINFPIIITCNNILNIFNELNLLSYYVDYNYNINIE